LWHLLQCFWCLFFRFISVLDDMLCSANTSFAFLCWWQYSSITSLIKSSVYCFFNHQIVNVVLQSWQRYLCVWVVDPYLIMWSQLHFLQFIFWFVLKFFTFVVLHLLVLKSSKYKKAQCSVWALYMFCFLLFWIDYAYSF
jgi:hypothetical protein